MEIYPIVVIGGGGHGKVVMSIIKKLPAYSLVGYTDLENKGLILGVPYLGGDEKLSEIEHKFPNCCAALGIGYLGKSDNRERIVEKLLALGFSMPSIISPQALINEDVLIGEGTVIMDGVIVNSGSHVEKFVILNTRCSVDHDCEIGDFTHIAPGATLSGGVQVGSHSLIGVGATIIQYAKICANCIVGAGAVVVKDCLEAGTYVGVPAKKIEKKI